MPYPFLIIGIDYYGYRQLTHGNLHGTAMYQNEFVYQSRMKEIFSAFGRRRDVCYYCFNKKELGRYPVGRTTLTLDVTDALIDGTNKLELKVEHPEMISDMPWVWWMFFGMGFSEGSQPFGIFRPVILEATDEIRIEPLAFTSGMTIRRLVYIDTEVKNYGNGQRL